MELSYLDVFLKKYYMKFLYSDTSSLGIVYLGAASTVSIEYLLPPLFLGGLSIQEIV